MVTIKDIAEKANVSIASVSRYFNNKELLHPETCARIEKVVMEYGYVPNSIGRSLRMARSGKILVLLPSISNPMYQKMISSINSECQQRGYTVLTCTTNNNKYNELHLLSMLETHYVDGAIFFSTTQSREEFEKLSRRFPLVQCCEYIDADVSGVTIDNEKAAFDAVNYLVSRGHRKIAMASGMEVYGTTYSRELGYRRALEENGIRFNKNYIIRGEYGFSSGAEAAAKFLKMKDIPDGLLTVSDAVAIGAMREFVRNKMVIGKDISIIGFDNTRIADMYIPSLSSVSQPREEMGKKAVELLFERMKSLKAKTRLIMLEHKLVIRDSVRK